MSSSGGAVITWPRSGYGGTCTSSSRQWIICTRLASFTGLPACLPACPITSSSTQGVQHEQLQRILKGRGFGVTVLPVILGVAGTIYKTTLVLPEQYTKLSLPHCQKMALKTTAENHCTSYVPMLHNTSYCDEAMKKIFRHVKTRPPKTTKRLGTVQASIA